MKRLSVLFFVLTFPALAITTFAQFSQDTVQREQLSTFRKKRMAKKLYKHGSYYNALEYYNMYYEARPEKTSTAWKIAELNYFLRDYKMAEKWYGLLADSNSEDYPKARYYYALMQKYNGKYDEAEANFNKFIKDYLADDSEEFNKMAEKQLEGCKLAKEQMNDPVRSNIIHLDENVNNPFSDYAPKPQGKDTLYYSTLQSDTVLDLLALKGVDYYSKIFTTTMGEEDHWTPGVPLEGPVNSSEDHTGNEAFSPDGKKMYFTRCWEAKKMKIRCEIYVSKKAGETWSKPERLNDEINLKKTTNTQPAIGLNSAGKEVLYFVSDREGGVGGLDLWYAPSKGGDDWGTPVNLGPTINTAQDEISPYYDNKNKKLYFSSNGLVNIGGYDAFVTEGSEGQWNIPQNVGYPLNSSTDDMYYYLADDEKNGFFVSNRPGGFSLKSETCCDDIYQFNIIKEIYMDGYVATKKDPETPIADADVSVFTVHGDNLVLLSNFKTGEEEHFVVPLDPETVYQVNATKAGYWGSEEVIDMKTVNVKDTLFKVFYLEEIVRRKIKLKRIYYNFDKYNLTKQYKTTLDSLYNILVENDSFTLDIIGHTDALGSDKYNEELGKRRAESAADYLMKKGISEKRLSLISKGESEPIAENAKPNGQDNPLGRAQNRRVEFRINTNDPYLEIDIEYENNQRKDTK